MAPPDFLVVGHLVQDKVARGYRLGGTAAYASLTAHRLGLRTAILTRAAADLDLSSLPPDIEVHRLPSPQTTVFENLYSRGLPPRGRRPPFAADGRVGQLSPRQWQPSAEGGLLRHSRALFVSEEDLPPAETEEALGRRGGPGPILFFPLGYP